MMSLEENLSHCWWHTDFHLASWQGKKNTGTRCYIEVPVSYGGIKYGILSVF